MTDGAIVVHDLVVAMDYGQFLLWGGLTNPWADGMDLLTKAQGAGDGVAADDGIVLVLSPHQNNFEMALRVEVWPSAPDDDLDRWEEAFEAPLEIGPDGQLWFQSPTMNAVSCNVPPGRYRLLVCGRGFVASGWPGSTTPEDSWRVRLWPGIGDVAARRVRSRDTSRPSPAPPTTPVAIDGRPWTERLRAELLGRPPGNECCRRAEAATLLRLARDVTADNHRVADRYWIDQRLQLLLGDRAQDPRLALELRLVNSAGVGIIGLPPGLVMAGVCCATAVWRGAVGIAGELVPRSGRLHALVWCPNVETVMGLIGAARRIGIVETSIDEAGDGQQILIKDGRGLLDMVGATETAAAWRAATPG